MQRLAGVWTGTYEYLEPPLGSPGVGFTLELLDGSSWRLLGEVWDDSIGGMEGRGTISGWSLGRYVWFLKVMPFVHVWHDPKPIALEDYLQAHFGERLPHAPGRQPISYRGIVARDRQAVQGTWRMPHRWLSLASGRVVLFQSARGTWEMRRR